VLFRAFCALSATEEKKSDTDILLVRVKREKKDDMERVSIKYCKLVPHQAPSACDNYVIDELHRVNWPRPIIQDNNQPRPPLKL
jgi:hypothetical protein